MRYKCLILDHDDTAVDSTPNIHYPSFLKVLKKFRPGTHISLDTWLEKNFKPGFMEYVTEELKFTNEELEGEMEIWRQFTSTRIPPFFKGFIPLLRRFKDAGGIITVVSHSEIPSIKRDYHHGEAGDLPQLIFGWHENADKRKPHPYPVEQILSTFNLKPEEALIVDDLFPAVEMGRAAGVDVVGAGWSHRIPLIQETMSRETLAYFTSIENFESWLFEE
jgi:phosphoglycolate phosphatase-like HAD superfamily hydrolase